MKIEFNLNLENPYLKSAFWLLVPVFGAMALILGIIWACVAFGLASMAAVVYLFSFVTCVWIAGEIEAAGKITSYTEFLSALMGPCVVYFMGYNLYLLIIAAMFLIGA